jgi:cytochrome c-type biogenesis protein
MSSNETPAQVSEAKNRPFKHLFLVVLFGGTIGLILITTQWETISAALDSILSVVGNKYQKWFEQQQTSAPVVLLPLAFLGGLLSSFSPCILPMLPINLSYIGTLNIVSRWDAFKKASLFVLGATTALSLFGLFSSLSTALFVDYRGPVNIAIGLIIMVMGLSMAGLFYLRLPQLNFSLPSSIGPYGVGLTFALVTSPCASPVLFSVLAAGASTGSQLLSTLAMVSFALGYTALIFLASLFAGLAKQARTWTSRTGWVPRCSSVILILAGGYYLVSGIRWYF